MKSELLPKSQDAAHEGLTKVGPGVALDHENQFDLAHTILKVFIFEGKNAIN